MIDIYSSLSKLKHFSEYKPLYLDIPLVNISDRNVEILCESNTSPSASYSRDIIDLLQVVLKFRANYRYVDESQSESFLNYVESSKDIVVSHPSLDNLPDTFELLLPTFRYRLALLCKTSNLQVDKDIFVRNVTGYVWLYLGAALMLVAFCFRLSTNLHHHLKPRHSDWSWLEVVQWSLGAICQQGSAKHPQGCSCRTMFLIGYCTTYLIYTGFAAGITSLLAIKTNTQELDWTKANRLDIALITLCDSEGEDYVKNLNDGQSRSDIKCVDNIEDIISKVRDSPVAAVVSEATVVHHITQYMDDNIQCEMSMSRQNHYNYYSGFVVEQSSVLKQPFNYWLLRFMEYGILKRMLRVSSKPMPLCQSPPGYTEVGFEHVQTAFLIFTLSMLTSLILFCLELLVMKNRSLIPRVKERFSLVQRYFIIHSNLLKNRNST